MSVSPAGESAAKLVTKDEARRIAANIAKLPSFCSARPDRRVCGAKKSNGPLYQRAVETDQKLIEFV
jgi:hypothetical protein